MVGLYVYLIKKGTITIDQVSSGWKAEVYAVLIIDGFYTMDDVPADWQDAVTAKLQELQS